MKYYKNLLQSLFAPLTLLYAVNSFAQEYTCNDVFVDTTGLAWEINNAGAPFTGTLNCEGPYGIQQSTFVNGYKHGVEIRKFDAGGAVGTVTVTFHYHHGELIQTCTDGIPKDLDIPNCQKR